MSKKIKKSYVRSTKDGRLYIPSEDFFKQDKALRLLERLLDSSVYKELESKKSEAKGSEELEPA